MRILIADDSAIVRAIIEQNLTKKGNFKIIASVSNGRKAIDSCRALFPDIVITDVDMPEMDGIESTKIITKELKIPVIVLGDTDTLAEEAKKAGAYSFLKKPEIKDYNSTFFERLIKEINNDYSPSTAAKSKDSPYEGSEIKIVCLGASTGGPTAVASVLSNLGRNFPLPIIYSQHIEIGADKKMVQWFDKTCKNIHVKLAEDGEEAKEGTVYMAPADKHLLIDFVKPNGHPVLKVSDDPPERFLRPAVNKMFKSAAQFYGKSCLAVLLTGMGRDGADGCKTIVSKGGYTIAEDRSTCAVFGMPAAAIEVGGAKEVLPRDKIPSRILELIKKF